jgi:hypothetical protein
MLPLVRQISQDIMQAQDALKRLVPERDRLNRRRHALTWPERSRRYQVQEEIVTAELKFQESLLELENLGVALVDANAGWVGFPTVVNGKKAFFSWKPGEETLKYWHFAGETARRLIPATWIKADDVALSGKS